MRAEHIPKQKYLAVHDYGMGGTWVFVWARGAAEIHKRLPGLKIMDEYPSWLNGDQLKRVEDTEPLTSVMGGAGYGIRGLG